MLYSVIKRKYNYLNQQISLAKLRHLIHELTLKARKHLEKDTTLSPIVLENLNLDLIYYGHKNQQWLSNSVFYSFFKEYLEEFYCFNSNPLDSYLRDAIVILQHNFDMDLFEDNSSEKAFIKHVCHKGYNSQSHFELLHEICISEALFHRLHQNINVVIQTMNKIKSDPATKSKEKTFVGGLDRIMIEAILEFFSEQQQFKYQPIQEKLLNLNQSCGNLISDQDLESLLIQIETLGNKLDQKQLLSLLQQGKIPSKLKTKLVKKEDLKNSAELFAHIPMDKLRAVIRKLKANNILFILKAKGQFLQLKKEGTDLVKSQIVDHQVQLIKENYKAKPKTIEGLLKYGASLQSEIIQDIADIDQKEFLSFVTKKKKHLAFEALGQAIIEMGNYADKKVMDFYQDNLDPKGLSYIRKCVCKGLARKKTAERVKILGTLAQFEKSMPVKLSAIEALGEIGNKSCLPTLHNLMQAHEDNIPVQNTIQRATDQIKQHLGEDL